MLLFMEPAKPLRQLGVSASDLCISTICLLYDYPKAKESLEAFANSRKIKEETMYKRVFSNTMARFPVFQPATISASVTGVHPSNAK